jgi:hypothetical protein
VAGRRSGNAGGGCGWRHPWNPSTRAGSGWRPVVLPTCASHRERSRLGVVLVVVADLPYQVGFASLERKLEVPGELAADGRRGPWALWFELPGVVVLVGVPLCRSRWRLGRFCAAQQADHTDVRLALVVVVASLRWSALSSPRLPWPRWLEQRWWYPGRLPRHIRSTFCAGARGRWVLKANGISAHGGRVRTM